MPGLQALCAAALPLLAFALRRIWYGGAAGGEAARVLQAAWRRKAARLQAKFDGETPANSLVSVEERRLQILDDNFGQWDLGATTIWEMQKLFGTDLLFFVLESSFRRLRLFEALAIDAGKLRALAEAISRGYRQLPYHNAVHACDVTHATAWLLLQTAPPTTGRVDGGGGGAPPTCVQAMPPYAVLAAMLAAAMHDINHDGHNNTYHQQSGSEWALIYNDKQILENMHCSTGLRLLRSSELDVLENLPLAERRNLRTLVREAILGTDLSVHFEQLSQLQLKLDEGLKLSGDDNDLPLFLAFIMHAADIGSTAKPAKTYFKWMQRVFVEFFATGDLQKAAGYEVQPFMDREQASIAEAQQGFLKYICQPVFQAIATYCPAAKQTVAHCGHNIAVLQELEKRYHSTPDQGRGAMLQMELVELLRDFPLLPPAFVSALNPRAAIFVPKA